MAEAAIGQDLAEMLALRALGWLAGQEDVFLDFLAAGGLDVKSLRRRAGEPEVLGAVLDFILAEDERVLGFAAAAGLRPEDVVRARAALPGGRTAHWT